MVAIPKLSDIPAVNRRYEAGDCLIAAVTTDLTNDQRDKIIKSVTKFAGADVSVIVVNVSRFSLFRKRAGESDLLLAKMAAGTTESKLGVANIDLAKCEFQEGDLLIAISHVELGESEKYVAKMSLNNWVRGKSVEVYVANAGQITPVHFPSKIVVE